MTNEKGLALAGESTPVLSKEQLAAEAGAWLGTAERYLIELYSRLNIEGPGRLTSQDMDFLGIRKSLPEKLHEYRHRAEQCMSLYPTEEIKRSARRTIAQCDLLERNVLNRYSP